MDRTLGLGRLDKRTRKDDRTRRTMQKENPGGQYWKKKRT